MSAVIGFRVIAGRMHNGGFSALITLFMFADLCFGHRLVRLGKDGFHAYHLAQSNADFE